MMHCVKSDNEQTLIEAELRPTGQPPFKVLPNELLPIFPHAHTAGTKKTLWCFSDSFLHLGRNAQRSTAEWQLKQFQDYSEQRIGSFHPQVHFSTKAGATLQWMVESIEQLIAAQAKDKLTEKLQNDVLVICCMTEAFQGNALLAEAKTSSLVWAQKLADLAKRLPNFPFLGPGNDQTWTSPGFSDVCKPIN